MKRRIVFILAFAALFLTAAAQKYTNLAVEALFDGRYNDHPNTSVSIIKSPGTVFRKLAVSGNQKIVSEMERLVRRDSENVDGSIVENYSKGEYEMIFTVGTASIGFTRSSKSDADLWVNCPINSSSSKRKTTKSSSRSFKSKKPSASQMNLTARDKESSLYDKYQCTVCTDDSGSNYSYDYDCNDGKGRLDFDFSGLKDLEDLDLSSLNALDFGSLESLKDLEISLNGLEHFGKNLGREIGENVKEAVDNAFRDRTVKSER